MAKEVKRYPFSAAKNTHNIELAKNMMFNMLYDAEAGDSPLTGEQVEKLSRTYEKVLEIDSMCFGNGPVIYLTGEQIGLAKAIIAWAREYRTQKCIETGDFNDLQYC